MCCYLAASGGYAGFLFLQRNIYNRGAYALILAGFILHTILLGLEYANTGFLPVRNLHQNLWFIGWVLAGVFLAVRPRIRVNILGVFAAPLITLITAAAFVTPNAPAQAQPELAGFWLVIHVVVIFTGEACLALACGTGILYLIQERNLKVKKHRFFFKRLPSLDLLDSAGYTFVAVGFTALTAGLITGFIYAHQVWGHFWSWDPKEVWSGITWLIYAALLHERLVAGWRGRRAAVLAIIGFAAMLFTFLGVNFLLEGHHNAFTRW
ncbi:MAG: c-type cytochrome biogenesis protein CcsB [Desulfobacteraceae bacterium]|nr:c-type cytochrome biogenesis protein CcsB [Desulfobacteraceae bacterium]MCF8094018.1 c-type cytochrome biogenesis protein CcsB [Desulfobacteraceae bacterium]